MPFNPIVGTKDIVDSYKRYLLTTFQTSLKTLNEQLKEKLNEAGAIANGPFISISQPYKKSKTLKELYNDNKELMAEKILNIIPFNKTLYSHQVKAIEKAIKGESVVVTTGTSSGKTECFLIPVINQLLKEKEQYPNQTLPAGVRTLIIYPLNALVNDQLKRLVFDDEKDENGYKKNIFEYIKDTCPDIKIGMYIGTTEEDDTDITDFILNLTDGKCNNIEDFKEQYPNIVLTRNEMRENPPHILITNYTMLEYLLLRPTDKVFFDNPKISQYWKSIVLDEAHIYDGALGIEISTLLRRVKARINKEDIQFILTSATLGDENENENILNFANSLCSTKNTSKEFSVDSIVRAEKYQQKSEEKQTDVNFDFYDEFAKFINDYDKYDNEDKLEKLKTIIEYLKTSNIQIPDYIRKSNANNIDEKEAIRINEKNIKNAIYDFLSKDELYLFLKNEIIDKQKETYTNRIFSENDENGETINSLYSVLKDKFNNLTEQKLVNFITVASYATSLEGYNLFEAKYHMFLKGFNGIYVTLVPGEEKLYMSNVGDVDKFDNKIFSISFCSSCNALYLQGIIKNDIFKQKSYYDKDTEIIQTFLISTKEYDEDEIERSENENQSKNQFANQFKLCTKCGKIIPYDNEDGCEHDELYKITVIKVDKDDNEPIKECPCCHKKSKERDIFRPYIVGQAIATAVIGTALYKNLPEKYFPEAGLQKQFLTFSDSRQKAAYFASRFEDSYDKILQKAIIVQTWKNEFNDKNVVKIKDFISKVANKYISANIFSDDTKCKEEAKVAVINELVGFTQKDSMMNKGVFYFDIDIAQKEYFDGLNAEDSTNFVKRIIFDYYIKSGSLSEITYTEDKKNLYDFLYSDYVPDCKKLELYKKKKTNPKNKLFQIYQNKRTKLLKKLLGEDVSDGIIADILDDIYQALIRDNVIVKEEDRKSSAYRVNIDKIQIKRIDEKSLYRCPECLTITPFNIQNICDKSLNKCTGQLETLSPDVLKEELEDNHYKILYETLPIVKLNAQEHTAQLKQSEAKIVQNQFQKGMVNVLSCSTTFEMGIDLGSLETVLMRNMPPTTSNYTQRAGRAGRSKNASAFVLTYCLNQSHDLNYFQSPEKMINGSVCPHLFDISNKKIVLRHIYASALSFYWKNPKYEKFYRIKINDKYVSNMQIFYDDNYSSLEEKTPYDLNGYTTFKKYIEDGDDELKEYLRKIVAPLSQELQEELDIENFGWKKYLFEDNEQDELYPGALYALCSYNYIETLNNINNVSCNKYNSIGHNKSVKEESIISHLSQNNILPKYSFPTDLVTLSTESEQDLQCIELQRGLSQAITEYAPDSRVIAKKKICTSKYVNKIKGRSLPGYYYKYCENCGTLNISTQGTALSEKICCCCGEILPEAEYHFIVPKFGFSIGKKEEYICDEKEKDHFNIDSKDTKWKGNPVENAKSQFPEKTYAGDIYYISKRNEQTFSYLLQNSHQIDVICPKASSAELAIINKSAFYICPYCGYSGKYPVNDKQYANIPFIHKMKNGDVCKKSQDDFEHLHNDGYSKNLQEEIGYKYCTDAVIIQFKTLNIKIGGIDKNKKQMPITEEAISMLYALLEGISRTLHINRNEIDGCLHSYIPNHNNKDNLNLCFVIFDKTPGGSGYVTQIIKDKNILSQVLKETYNFVKHCPEKDCSENSSCYGCLRNYGNQRFHELLKRSLVINLLEQLDSSLTFQINSFDKKDKNDNINEKVCITYKPVYNNNSEYSTENYGEIISKFLNPDEYELSETDKNALLQIKGIVDIDKYEKPIIGGKLLNQNNEEIYIDFMWKNSKIVCFFSENQTEYEKILGSDWTAFVFDEYFDIYKFESKLKENQ